MSDDIPGLSSDGDDDDGNGDDEDEEAVGVCGGPEAILCSLVHFHFGVRIYTYLLF